MTQKERGKTKRFWYRLFISVLTWGIFFLSSVLLMKAMDLTMRSDGLFSPLFRVCVKSGILIFWFFSLTRTLMAYDFVYLSRYRVRETEKRTERLSLIFGNSDFWMEIFLFGVALQVVPRLGPFGFLVRFWEESVGVLPLDLTGGFLAITILPVFLIVLLFSHLSAQKYISGFDDPYLSALEGEGRKQKKQAFVEILQLAAIYFIGTLIVPLVLPFIMTMVKMLGKTPVLIFFLILLLSLAGFRYIRAFLKRRSFQKNLLNFCKEKRIRLEMHRGFFRSIVSMSKAYDFSVFIDEERYDCKMISSPRKYSPVFFEENGNLIRTRTIQLNKYLVLFHSVTVQTFKFSSEGKKVIILNPTPHLIYLFNGVKKTIADTGERIGEYVVFTGSGFLNALDRNCLRQFFRQK